MKDCRLYSISYVFSGVAVGSLLKTRYCSCEVPHRAFLYLCLTRLAPDRNIIARWEFWKSYVLHKNTYPNQICIWPAERLDQVPRKPGFRVKVAENLEGLIAVINDCVQSRLTFSCSFVGLAAFSIKLTMSTHKLCWTRTIVPNARELTYFCAFSSILTRIVSAAAVDTRDVTITWLHAMTLKVGITNILKSEETNHAGYLRKRPCFLGNRSNSDHNRFIYLFIYLLKRDVEKNVY